MIQTERHRIKKLIFINFPEFAINYPDSLLSYGNLHPQIQILNHYFLRLKDQLVNITNTRLDEDSFNTVNSLTKSIFFLRVDLNYSLLSFSTILSVALIRGFTHDQYQRHKLKPVFKIKSDHCMTRNAYLRPQVQVNFCQNSYCLRNVCKVSAHFIFLVIRHTNKGHIFCVWGLVLAPSSRKNSNKTILCNSKLTPLFTPLHSQSAPF